MSCKTCGTLLNEGTKFCVACGTRVEDEFPQPQPEQIQENFPNTKPAMSEPESKPVQTYPRSAPYPAPTTYTGSNYGAPAQEAPPKNSKYAPMSTLAYVGWTILMSLPVAGLIVTIILAVSEDNINRRNYARSKLVFMAISFVFAIIIAIIILIFWAVIIDNIDYYWGNTWRY